MAGQPRKRQRVEREIALLKEPETITRICEAVANHGSLGKWCRLEGVKFHNVHGWIMHDKDRTRLYTSALESRSARLTDKVIDKMETMIDADLRDAYGPKGKLKAVGKLPDSIAGAVVEVSDSPRGGVKLKLVAPDRATELLGRHLGMFRDKVEVSGEVGISTRLAAARQRASGRK